MLTATSLSDGKTKNSILYRIKTPNLIKIKFNRVDYVGKMTPYAKFYEIPSKGAFRQMGEIYAKFFLAIYFFLQTHLQVRPFGGFLRAMAQTTRSRACLLYTSPSPRD